MKYKTTIKLVTEAKDKREAMEIAGEYLSGNLTTGVDMRLRTSSICTNKQRLAVALVVALVVGLLVIPLSAMRHSQGFVLHLPGDSAILPPLKTSAADTDFSDFKKAWQTKHSQEILRSLKK